VSKHKKAEPIGSAFCISLTYFDTTDC
jgi:hypothetical protein